MARGRFISKEVSIDKKVNSLSSPWSMLGFTWLLTHADREGRTHGDPELVKSMIFARQQDISIADVEGFIREWNTVGLVNWYEVDGEMYIEFPNFDKHQVGLRKDKEPASTIPPNPNPERTNSAKVPEGFRKDSVNCPSELKEKLIELKEEGKEEEKKKPSSPTPNLYSGDDFVIKVFSQVTGMTSIPRNDERAYIAIEGLRTKYPTIDGMVTYLRPFYDSWITRRGKDGRFFSKTNLAWLTDWAVGGEIPVVVAPPKTTQEKNKEVLSRILGSKSEVING